MPSRSAPSTASISGIGACSTPSRRPGRPRRSSPSTRIRGSRSGYDVELLATLERRLELLDEAGIEETLVVEFDLELAQLQPEEFVDARAAADRRARSSSPARTSASAGRARRSRPARAARLRRAHACRSSRASRRAGSASCCAPARSSGAARLLGRPAELEGIVVAGDARGGTLGFPTANLRRRPAPARARVRDLRGRRGGAPRGDLDRHEPALRRRRAAGRGVPARLRGRPLRQAARAPALASPARRARLRERGRSSSRRSPATSRQTAPPSRPCNRRFTASGASIRTWSDNVHPETDPSCGAWTARRSTAVRSQTRRPGLPDVRLRGLDRGQGCRAAERTDS